jgi:hypothetical protein
VNDAASGSRRSFFLFMQFLSQPVGAVSWGIAWEYNWIAPNGAKGSKSHPAWS